MTSMLRTALLAGLTLLGCAVSGADACSCLDPGPPCQAYWTSDAIFRGRVESVEPVPSATSGRTQMASLDVRFTVLESFKGMGATTAVVRTTSGPATCGFRFTKGREYVVYTSLHEGRLVTSRCTRTAPTDKAQDDLEYARNILLGGAPLGRISGRVLLHVPSLWSSGYARPMREVPVIIQKGELAVGAVTDRQGNFAVSGLDAGSYTVSVQPRGRFRVETQSPVEIKDPRGCAVSGASVYPDGRVSGRVTDASGRPVRGLTVDLTVRRTDGRTPDRLRAATRPDGRYELTGVPPGHFIVGVGTADRSDVRAFYPGVARDRDAATIVVPLGGSLELPDFVIPGGTPLVEVTGVVFDDDGVPAEGARVYLKEAVDRGAIVTEAILTDLSGRFTITAPAGAAYQLFAERASGSAGGWPDSTELVPIDPSHVRPGLRLTLRQRR